MTVIIRFLYKMMFRVICYSIEIKRHKKLQQHKPLLLELMISIDFVHHLRPETLLVVTVTMICSILASSLKLQCFQKPIHNPSQTSTMELLFQTFISRLFKPCVFKVVYFLRLFKPYIFLKSILSFE